MKQEFIYLYGKVILEKDVLYIRNLNLQFLGRSLDNTIYPIGLLAFIGYIILSFFDPDPAMRYTRFVFLSVMILLLVPTLYEVFIRRSYARRIPLNRIVSIESREDNTGLETFVRLYFKSGRFREIIFRRLEGQHEPFMEIISRKIAQPQLT